MKLSLFLLDNIYIKFGNKLIKQIVDITNCAPLVTVCSCSVMKETS